MITEQWESIGPDKAMLYLESMDGNRTVRQTDVNYLAIQMKMGLWRETPQGIVFDDEGCLIDGQHRMWAVIESGVTIKIKVSRGWPHDTALVLDTGRTRSYADVAHYEGWDTDPLTGSCARLLALGPTAQPVKVPAQMLHDWYMHYKEGVDFALALRLSTRPRTGKSITLPMAAPFAAAYYHVERDMLTRFGAILQTGQFEVEADRAAFTLREAWLSGRIGTGRSEPYFKTEAAIKAFIERRPIKTLQRPEAIYFIPPKLPQNLRLDAAPKRRRKVVEQRASA